MFFVKPRPAPTPISFARAGAGIERVAVDRRVIDVVALLEEMLRAVAVVHVEVVDEDALDARLLAQPFRDAGDGVEEAEAHRLRALGVMSGRAGDDERALRFALQHARRRQSSDVATAVRAAAKVAEEIGLSSEWK